MFKKGNVTSGLILSDFSYKLQEFYFVRLWNLILFIKSTTVLIKVRF